MKAKITLEYADSETAKAVADAVSPDNSKTPVGLKVWTHNNGTSVVTDIVLKGTVATFIATIDDLLASASTAEKALHIVQAK